MSNFLESLLNNQQVNNIKNKAQETLANLNGPGGADSLKQGLGGLLGAGALGGLLGVLVSGKTAKKVAKNALVLGGSAAVGALAWQYYQKWSQQKSDSTNDGQSTSPQPAPAAPSAPAQPPQPALVLIEAMVFAARADGHIDEVERNRIYDTLAQMLPGQEPSLVIGDLLHKPLDPGSIAAKVTCLEEGYDIYKLSCLIVDVDHFMERSYLDGLAASLKLPPEVKFNLEQEAQALKQQLYDQA